MDKESILGLIQQHKKNKHNPIAILHLGLCKCVGGWVPYEEFLSLPIAVIMDILEVEEAAQEEISREVKRGSRKN